MNKAFTVTCLLAVTLAASSRMEDALANMTVTVGTPVNTKIVNNGDAKKMKVEDSKKNDKKKRCELKHKQEQPSDTESSEEELDIVVVRKAAAFAQQSKATNLR